MFSVLGHTMAYFQSGLTTAWRHKKTKSSLALSDYVRYFYLSVTAHRQPPSVTHRQPIKWFTCLVTGSEWQTAWRTVSWIAGSWPVLQARRLLFFFSFSSPSNAAALIARGWHVSRTGSTFFFFFASFALNASVKPFVSACVHRSSGFLPAFQSSTFSLLFVCSVNLIVPVII